MAKNELTRHICPRQLSLACRSQDQGALHCPPSEQMLAIHSAGGEIFLGSILWTLAADSADTRSTGTSGVKEANVAVDVVILLPFAHLSICFNSPVRMQERP